jgi:hypothetical protein
MIFLRKALHKDEFGNILETWLWLCRLLGRVIFVESRRVVRFLPRRLMTNFLSLTTSTPCSRMLHGFAVWMILFHVFAGCCRHTYGDCSSEHDHEEQEHCTDDFHHDHTSVLEIDDVCHEHEEDNGTCCSECQGHCRYRSEFFNNDAKPLISRLAALNHTSYVLPKATEFQGRLEHSLPCNSSPPRLFLVVQSFLL